MLDFNMVRPILDFLSGNGFCKFNQKQLPDWMLQDDKVFYDTMMYLRGHALISFDEIEVSRVPTGYLHNITITSKGLDYTRPDGGLTAQNGTLTVKFDEEQVRLLLQEYVAKAPVDQKEKAGLLAEISKAPATALAEAVKQSVGLLVRQGPDLIKTLHDLIR